MQETEAPHSAAVQLAVLANKGDLDHAISKKPAVEDMLLSLLLS